MTVQAFQASACAPDSAGRLFENTERTRLMSLNIAQRPADEPGVRDVNVDLTFSPPWDPKTMASDDIKMQLGIW